MEPLKQDASFDAQFNRTKYVFWVNGRETSSCSVEFATHQTGRVSSATATFEGGGSFGGENRTWISFPPDTKLVSLSVVPAARRGAILGASVGQPSLTVWSNSDLEGGDLRGIKGTSQEVCSSTCKADPACVGYAYDKWNRWCFLKSSVGELRLDPQSISGIKEGAGEPMRSSAPLMMQRYRGKKFSQSAGELEFAAPSLDACEEQCQNAPTCVAVSFGKSSRQCRLITDAGEYHADASADSSVKRQAASR